MKKAKSILIVLTVLSVFQSRADVPTAPLTPVWEKLAENGFVTVTADGIGADGKVCGRAGSRRFWKMPRFRPGTYEPPKRGYLEAANRIYDYVFELPSTQYFLEAGKLSDAEPAAFCLQRTGSVSFENSVLSWDPAVLVGFRKAFSVIDAEQPSVDVNSRIGVGHACDF